MCYWWLYNNFGPNEVKRSKFKVTTRPNSQKMAEACIHGQLPIEFHLGCLYLSLHQSRPLSIFVFIFILYSSFVKLYSLSGLKQQSAVYFVQPFLFLIQMKADV